MGVCASTHLTGSEADFTEETGLVTRKSNQYSMTMVTSTIVKKYQIFLMRFYVPMILDALRTFCFFRKLIQPIQTKEGQKEENRAREREICLLPSGAF